MTVGDRVVVLEDVLNYGVGAIQGFTRDGRINVVFPGYGKLPPHREDFDAHELELASVWMQAR